MRDKFIALSLEHSDGKEITKELNERAPKGYRFVSLLPRGWGGLSALFEKIELQEIESPEEKEILPDKIGQKKKENRDKIGQMGESYSNVDSTPQDGWVNPIHRMMSTTKPVGSQVQLIGYDRCGGRGMITKILNDGTYEIEMEDGCIDIIHQSCFKP